jgi:hypothetical protein
MIRVFRVFKLFKLFRRFRVSLQGGECRGRGKVITKRGI